MRLFFRLFCTLCLIILLQGCISSKKPDTQIYQLGTGSRVDILSGNEKFTRQSLPKGWVLDGPSVSYMFSPQKKIRNIFMTTTDGYRGLHIQNDEGRFILARYTNTRLLVTPYLGWYWHVSEHKGLHHPVKILVGLYGGRTGSRPLSQNDFIWRAGAGLPPYDRLLTIGFEDMALKRGNLYDMGSAKYYAQRGGIEQTNQWYFETTDLSLVYKQAWPEDNSANAFITFVGFFAENDAGGGGITFSKMSLNR